jgi:hypothetical protein
MTPPPPSPSLPLCAPAATAALPPLRVLFLMQDVCNSGTDTSEAFIASAVYKWAAGAAAAAAAAAPLASMQPHRQKAGIAVSSAGARLCLIVSAAAPCLPPHAPLGRPLRPLPCRSGASLHAHWRAGSLNRTGLHWTGNATDIIRTVKVPCESAGWG